MSTEDVRSCDELQLWESQPALHEALLRHRDARLIDVLEAVLLGTDGARIVGVLYGAAHMSSVTDWLMGKHGFQVVHSEWLTVFEYADV
jgi:hypothetical protein